MFSISLATNPSLPSLLSRDNFIPFSIQTNKLSFIPTYHEEEEVFTAGQPSALDQLINEVVSLINELISTHLAINKTNVVLEH